MGANRQTPAGTETGPASTDAEQAEVSELEAIAAMNVEDVEALAALSDEDRAVLAAIGQEAGPPAATDEPPLGQVSGDVVEPEPVSATPDRSAEAPEVERVTIPGQPGHPPVPNQGNPQIATN